MFGPIDTTIRSLEGTTPTPEAPQPAAQPSAVQPTAPVQQKPQDDSWWNRASANAADAWRTGTLAGAATTMVQTGIGTDEADVQKERTRRENFANMQSWMEAPDAMGKLKNFSAMVAGQVVGNVASPESLLGIPAKGIAWAAKGATALSRVGRRAAVGGATQAAWNTATDPIVQGANIVSNVQDEYKPEQTALAPVAGAVGGGVTGTIKAGFSSAPVRNAEEAIALRETVTGRPLQGWERAVFIEAAEKIAETQKPESLAKYAGNLNLERIRAGEDVFKLIAETAEANKPMIDAIRRGSISNEQLKQMADDLQLTPEAIINMSKPGVAVNAEVATASRAINIDMFNDWQAATSLAAKSPTPENLARQQAVSEMARQVFLAVSGFSAEAGRTLQAFNIVMPDDQRVRVLQTMFERYPNLAQDAQAQIALMKAIETPAGLRDMLAKLGPLDKNGKPSTMAKFVEAWKSGLLTGIRTTTTNVIGSASSNVLDTIAQMGAATIGKISPKAGDKETGRSMTGAMSRLYSIFGSPNDDLRAWDNFLQAWRTGETPKVFRTRTEGEDVAAIPGKAGEIIRTPFRFLTAQDAFFKAIAARQELTAIAWDRVLKLPAYENASLADKNAWVRTFVSTPPEDALRQAQLQANYLTFNKELGKLGRDLTSTVNKYPQAQFVLPFVKTPINIAKFGFEYTPLVYINPAYRDLKGQERDLAAAKVITGSSLMFGFYSMALEGRITGAGPIDPTDRQQLMETGWKPYSIRIGDKYYPYEKMQPVAFLLGIASDLAYMSKQIPQKAETRGLFDKDGEITQQDLAVAYGVHIFMENVVNNSFTSQLNNLFKALNDPTENAVNAITNTFAGSLVPTIVGDVARAIDPTERQINSPLEAIQSRIPGASSSLFPKRDWTGQEKVRSYSPIEQMISPSLPSTVKEDKAGREIARVNFKMPTVPKTFYGRTLNPEQRDYYAQVIGEDRAARLRTFVNSPGYDDMAKRKGGDEIIRQQMTKVTSGVTKAVEAKMRQRYPDLLTAKEDQTIRAFNLPPVQEDPSLRRR